MSMKMRNLSFRSAEQLCAGRSTASDPAPNLCSATIRGDKSRFAE
jgi:hypothetical protein